MATGVALRAGSGFTPSRSVGCAGCSTKLLTRLLLVVSLSLSPSTGSPAPVFILRPSCSASPGPILSKLMLKLRATLCPPILEGLVIPDIMDGDPTLGRPEPTRALHLLSPLSQLPLRELLGLSARMLASAVSASSSSIPIWEELTSASFWYWSSDIDVPSAQSFALPDIANADEARVRVEALSAGGDVGFGLFRG